MMFVRIFDLHCDTSYECVKRGENLTSNSLVVSSESYSGCEIRIQTFAVWSPDFLGNTDKINNFIRQTDFLRSQAKIGAVNILDETFGLSDCMLNAVISVENLPLFEKDMIETLKSCNVRLASLTWNSENQYAGGAMSKAGLTELGKQTAEQLEAGDIVLDVSHLNDKSFYQLERISKKPFIASHSNARAVLDHPRNLTDDQIRIIAERNGLIGINYYSEFLGENRTDALKHIEHILNTAGRNIVALGSDFDGAEPAKGLENDADVAFLYDDVVKYFGQDTADRIFYHNAVDFFADYILI